MLNGVTELIMMKADVLDTFEKIQVCTHYRHEGKVIDYMPYEIITNEAEPILEEIDGWNQDLTGITQESEIPTALQNYITYLEKALEVPITFLSVGPDRKQTLKLTK
ncbi:Adenylosuccinate synthetase [compost metagenome]